MRTARGRGNDARKVLTYYSINFDIHPPFQVLCDGPIISLSIRNNLYLKQSLPKLLGSTAYPVVTNCIVSELKSLGEDFSGAALFAKRLTRVPCANAACNEQVGNASACILARLRKQDDLRLMLATNDTELIRSLATTVGVPLITVENQTKLVLRPPGRETLDYVRRTEGSRGTLVSESDRAFLRKVHAEALSKMPPKRQRMELRKRKRAKGPNPLSVRKAKHAKRNHDGQQHGINANVSALQDSESGMKGDHVPKTIAEVNNPTEKLDIRKDEPVVDVGEDAAERVDASDEGQKQSHAPLPVASVEKAKRKRPRNRKTSRNSESTGDIQPTKPDHKSQEVSPRRAGGDTGQACDNEGRTKEVSGKVALDSASTDQRKLPSIPNETQTAPMSEGNSVRTKMQKSSTAVENQVEISHENYSGRAISDLVGKGRSVGVDKAKARESASTTFKSATSEIVETEGAANLADAKTQMDMATTNPPGTAQYETKVAVDVVHKKKKHRNNRRRRPKKMKEASADQESSPPPAGKD